MLADVEHQARLQPGSQLRFPHCRRWHDVIAVHKEGTAYAVAMRYWECGGQKSYAELAGRGRCSWSPCSGKRLLSNSLRIGIRCALRDSDKAFYLFRGCVRSWMNQNTDERQSSGINMLWPDTANPYYIEALAAATAGLSPNNISPIVKYSVERSAVALWMGDRETDFMEDIAPSLTLPKIDILFAPHHGRDSGRIPQTLLDQLEPQLVVIGEAPAQHLNYYEACDTITQNRAGHITFELVENHAHVYVSNPYYESDYLMDRGLADSLEHGHHIGSLIVGANQ